MKVIKLLFLVSIIFLAGCEKTETFNNTDTQVGHSRVTFFVDLQLKGNAIMSIVSGSAFTDPGVIAKENGQDVPVTTSGTVNTSQAGSYTINYSATNKDGFTKSVSRQVFVLPSAEQAGVDLSGTYLPIGGAPANATIAKVAPGVYSTSNCWGGGSAAVIPAFFICVDGASVILPLQNSVAGRIQSEGPGTYVAGLITWTITRLDFGSGPLTVQKKWQKI